MTSLEAIAQDLRFGLRSLRKTPSFTLVAILSLALGVGVNTAMFSVINAVLFRPLPYPDPGRLVRVTQTASNGDISYPEYEFWKTKTAAFTAMTGYRGGGDRRLTTASAPQWINTLAVSSDFLRTLGVDPALGRDFLPEETLRGGPQAILLSDALWRRTFGSDPKVIGRAVTIDDSTYTVVGVLRSDFLVPAGAEALLPLRYSGGLDDTGTNTQAIARLKDGVSMEQARAEMAGLTEAFRQKHADRISKAYRGLTILPYQAWLVGDVRLNLMLLFGATTVLLFIACFNLATLLMSRFAARRKEIGIRLALGSGRLRLMAQYFVENLLLTLAGAGVGLAAGYALLQVLVAWMPFRLPATAPIAMDGMTLAFTTAVTFLTAVIFTLVPLVTAKRLNVQESLRSAGKSAGADGVRHRTRNVLVIGEVALSATLLIGAALLIQSLYRIGQQHLGFSPGGLIVFDTPFEVERARDNANRQNFTKSLQERLSGLPGIRGVAAVNLLPLSGWSNLPTQRDGHPDQSIGGMEVRVVSPEYFALMGIPVRQGRTFSGLDTAGSPPVTVINETLARRWWPGGDAIGDRLTIGRFQGRSFPGLNDPSREVIGIIADTKTVSAKEPTRPTLFLSLAQGSSLSSNQLSWIVKNTGNSGLAGQIRGAVADVDPGQRVVRMRTMDQIVSKDTAEPRFNAILFALFAGVALLLSALGVYGVLAFLVAQRRQEIGTRMAFGATRGNILRLFLRQGLALISVGLAIGLTGAVFAGRWLASLLYGVKPNDVFSFAAVTVVLLAAGLAASLIPARRAAKADPMVSLRYE